MHEANALETVGRLLVVFFFLATGIGNMTRAQIRSHIERMEGFGTPFPAAAFWLGIALQFAGCALILLGWHAELGVYCLIVFTVVATAIFHRFWQMDDPVKRNVSRIFLLQNTGTVGALLLVLATLR